MPTALDLKLAVEAGQVDTLLGFYAPDAELTILDNTRPPSNPLTVLGADAIGGFLKDVYSRPLSHRLSDMVVNDLVGFGYLETCIYYEDGLHVVSANIVLLNDDGQIIKQTVVQAWG